MSAVIYTLCALAALTCAALLLNGYRRSGYRLLLWSGLCFVGLTANNVLLIMDKVVFPEIDFSLWRVGLSFLAMGVLLYGLVWEAE